MLAVAVLASLSFAAGVRAAPALIVAAPVEPMATPDIPGARLVPVRFSDLKGWKDDDLAAAFRAFRASCGALRAPPAAGALPSADTLVRGLLSACAAADALGLEHPSREVARLFFELNFRPYRVMPDTHPDAFLTGYYEPEVEGALERGGGFEVPVYARPSDLVMTAGVAANGGGAMRMENGREVPYYDRAEIEDGALKGRGLELVYLKDPVDLFFMQIQGSGRVRLPGGRVLRLNYDGYNGQPYTPVGKLLIQRGLVSRDEMSMERIRAFMEQHPDAGRELRRENRSFVFFKALELSSEEGAMGAQGVSLTAGRSLAVDRRLHTFGSPFFVEAVLPLSAPRAADAFRRLMIAQDTGSAIVGPGRADLFFGAGAEAGAVAGRIRHRAQLALLVPRFAEPDLPTGSVPEQKAAGADAAEAGRP
ncbi:murein transglycosylase A [Xanthobacter sp. V2C-8]|uniref:murein transglycosylase A n=1 Tax=Xanthobacter albus TaxID=3119929 RepID=UPI003727725A